MAHACAPAALLGVLTATVVKFHKVDPAAAYIMMPYLGWTTFATVLTIDIYRRNPDVWRLPNIQQDQLQCFAAQAIALHLVSDCSSHFAWHEVCVRHPCVRRHGRDCCGPPC